ncbi:hypothetical protein GJ496_010547 [Pomphorhynchus laevis]|nr:hypothetical protein GJ496_010547 [Pomphorhynchus laevis]
MSSTSSCGALKDSTYMEISSNFPKERNVSNVIFINDHLKQVLFVALAHVQGQELCARTALLLVVQIEVVERKSTRNSRIKKTLTDGNDTGSQISAAVQSPCIDGSVYLIPCSYDDCPAWIKKLETKLAETNQLVKVAESNIVSLQDSITKPIDIEELTKYVSILKSEIVELKTINNLPFDNAKMEHIIMKSWAYVASKGMPALIRRHVAQSIVATTQVPSAEVSTITINRAINAEAFRARNLIIKGIPSSDDDTSAIVDLLRKIGVNVGRSDIKNTVRLQGIRREIPRWLKTTLTEPIVTESLRSASKLRHLQGCVEYFYRTIYRRLNETNYKYLDPY